MLPVQSAVIMVVRMLAMDVSPGTSVRLHRVCVAGVVDCRRNTGVQGFRVSSGRDFGDAYIWP